MNDKACFNRSIAGATRRCRPLAWLLMAAACSMTMLVIQSARAADSLEFRFADGSFLVGELAAAGIDGTFAIRSTLLDGDLVVSTKELLEGRHAEASKAGLGRRQGSAQVERREFAFVLRDGCQFVGSIAASDEDGIDLATETLGKIRLNLRDVVGVTELARTPMRLFSLGNSKSRYQCEPGWEFLQQGLKCEMPGSAAVAKLDLPDRFRVRFVVRCDGVPDFEISLGDRSTGGAGQGRAGVDRRVDRRGGSLSRLPTERYVTRLEWLDRSVSIVRSNASVSDAAVFEVDGPIDATSTDRKLELDLFIDQQAGTVSVFRQGLKIARANLTDDEPVVRRMMTLINRGDPVFVRQLDLFKWDGVEPESRMLPQRYALLGDGRLVEGAIDGLGADGIRIGDALLPWNAVAELRVAPSEETSSSCEWTLADGSRVRGVIVKDTASDAGANRDRIFVNHAGGTVAIPPESVTRFVGRADGGARRERKGTRLRAPGVDLSGSLLPGSKKKIPFRLRPYFGGDSVGIVPGQDSELRLEQNDLSAGTKIGNAETAALIEFGNGDRLGAKEIRLAAGQVSFFGETCGKTSVPVDAVERIQWSLIDDVDVLALETLLRLPRRMKETPPTHVVMSKDGDLLRGRLSSIDDQRIRLEVRGRAHDLRRDLIAQVIRLHFVGESSEETGTGVSVIARNGGKIVLKEVAFDGSFIVGEHPFVGQCRIEISDVQAIRFGAEEGRKPRPWTIVPVKEPRTFDERDEQ